MKLKCSGIRAETTIEVTHRPASEMAMVPTNQSRTLEKIDLIGSARLLPGLGAEEVSHGADGADQVAAVAELLAEVADMHVEHAVEGRGRALVKDGGQLLARDDAAGGTDEGLEQVEFGRRRLGQPPVDPDLTLAGDQPHAAHLQLLRHGRRSAGTPQDGPDPREELVGTERLGE